MTIRSNSDGFEVSSGSKLLDFTIDTSGVSLFVDNCSPVEAKQSTFNVQDCTTVNCTTVNCTTVNCTTVNCTTINCTTINCNDYEYTTHCNCQCSSDE